MPVLYNAAAANVGPLGRGVVIHSVVVGTGAAGTLTLYNGQSAAGTLIAVIDTTTANDYFFGDSSLTGGLFGVQTGTAKISIIYD